MEREHGKLDQKTRTQPRNPHQALLSRLYLWYGQWTTEIFATLQSKTPRTTSSERSRVRGAGHFSIFKNRLEVLHLQNTSPDYRTNITAIHTAHTTEQRVERHSDWPMNNRLIEMELHWFWPHLRNFLKRGRSKNIFPKNLTFFSLAKTWEKNHAFKNTKHSFWEEYFLKSATCKQSDLSLRHA